MVARQETLSPIQAFVALYGVEPTPLHIDNACRGLLQAMDLVAELAAYKDIPPFHCLAEDGLRHRQSTTAFQAVTLVFSPNIPLDEKQAIAKALEGGNTQLFKEEFYEVTALITKVSGQDLTWLNPYVANLSTEKLLEEARTGKIHLTQQQLAFLENRGFMTLKERRSQLFPL